MLDKMKEKLNLSDDQYNKLKAMHKSHMDAIKPLMDKMMADMDTLQKKVDAKASDSDLKTVLNSIESDRKNLAAMKEKFSAETTSVLTVTQQAKRLLFQKEEGKGMMGAAMKHMKNKKAAESSTPTSK
jgi:hypothetical protein